MSARTWSANRTPSCPRGCAASADAEDLDRVADIGEAVLARDVGRPRLDLTALHLDRAAAHPAHQVVVMVFRAAPVHRLAGIGAQGVDQAGGRHRLQSAVHGGQADALAAAAQFVMEILGGPEIVEVLQ